MKKFLFGVFFLLASNPVWGQPPASVPAKAGLFFKFQLDVFEEREGRVGLADSRTVELPEGEKRGVFLANFTLDLTARRAGQPSGNKASRASRQKVTLDFQLITLPPEITTKSGVTALDTGQALPIPAIPGKNGGSYRLAVTYQGVVRRPVDCSFEELKWYSDPSARYSFGFVRASWGDFHWNLLRDRVEELTDSLSRVFNLVTSQRPEYYFAPCLISDWVWDGRFYFSLEPSRRRAVSVYCREANSFDPWVPNLLLFYLVWGQAPAPLAEGAAAFFDYPHFFAQQYLKEGKLDSLARFITSYRYRQLPPEKALMEAASFVRFLVEQYGAGVFEKLYRGATDLTVKADLQKTFGKDLDSLEAEWRHHLGAFIPEAGPLRKLAQEDFWNYRFRDALELYLKAMALDTFPRAGDYEDIATQYYNLGRYDSALTFYEKVYGADSNNWERAYVVGNFFLLKDDTARAKLYYQKMLDLDSSAADGLAREGTYFFESGDFFKAESLYRLALKKRTRPNDLAELNLNLGYIAYRLKGDFTKGNEYLNAAWGFYRKVRSEAPGVPYPYWRLGELFLYKNMPDSAEANLKFAVFLETRPYYLAKLFIRLGNLFDVFNQRRKALEYYQQVLKLPAAPLDRRRAQAYLKKPFRLSAS